VTLRLFELPDDFDHEIHVPGGTGAAATFRVRRDGADVSVTTADAPAGWSVEVAGTAVSAHASGSGEVRLHLPA
jgi:alpha-D-xyloside xylohydrolase